MDTDVAIQLLVFRVGREYFAVPLADVQEVIDAPIIQAIPDAAPFVLGVATIADQFVVVYDPRQLLHVGGRIGGAALLFMREDRRVALAVSDVNDVMTVAREDIRPSPIAGAALSGVTGVVRNGTHLVAVLDSDALLGAAMHPQNDTARREIKRT